MRLLAANVVLFLSEKIRRLKQMCFLWILMIFLNFISGMF